MAKIIKSIMRKVRDNADGFIFGGLLSALVAGGGYFFCAPRGEQIKQNADGVITSEERESILGSIARPLTAYTKPLAGLLNDFEEFKAREFEAKGIPAHRFDDDLHVDFSDSGARFWCGNRAGACFNWKNDTVFVPENMHNFIEGLYGLEHEIGHANRTTFLGIPIGKTVSTMEVESTANAMYSALRMYSLDKIVGAEYAVSAAWFYNCNAPSEEAFPYILGHIGFLVQANKAGGDLEKAMHRLLTEDEAVLAQDTSQVVSKYNNYCSAFFGQYDKLLRQDTFFRDIEKHVGYEDATEFVHFLWLALIHEQNRMEMASGTLNKSGAYHKFNSLASPFLDTCKNNVFFRHVSNWLRSYE